MQRREFFRLAGGILITVPAGRLLIACGGDDEDNGDNGNGTQPLSFTSTNVDGHTHTVSIEVASIESPPAGGISETTSSVAGHTHTLALTEADLNAIDAGQTINKATTTDAGHSHSFELRRA